MSVKDRVQQHDRKRKSRAGAPSANGDGHSPESWEDPVPLTSMPEVEPFPLWVLPEGLQRFVTETAQALNCPPDLVAVPLLAMAGGAIGNTRHISITRTHRQPANLFIGVIGRPGTAKSPPKRILRRPFDAAQERYLSDWRLLMDEWKRKGDDKDDKKDRGPRPPLRRCVVADTTTESLALTLEENPRGVMMVRDELMELVGSMNQYKGGKGYDRQVYLKLWDGEPLTIDRKSDKSRDGAPLYVPRPFASIVGGLQPSVLDRFRGGESTRFAPPPDDGFLDRWLFAYPAELPAVGERWLEVSEEALDCWGRAVDWLLRLEMVSEEGGGQRPFFVDLGAEARRAWQRFTEAHAAEVNAEDFPQHLRGPWSKMRGYCGRLALILRALRWACDRPEIGDFEDCVDGPSMDAAARLVGYFKSHARKVYAALDADPRLADARRVLRWLEEHPQFTEFSRREVHQALKNSAQFNRPESLDAPLALLERHGYIRGLPADNRAGPGRKPSDRYQRNPLWGGSKYAQNPQNGADDGRSEHSEDYENTPQAGDAWEG